MGRGRGPPLQERCVFKGSFPTDFAKIPSDVAASPGYLGGSGNKVGFPQFPTHSLSWEGTRTSRWASRELELNFFLLDSQLQCKNLFINFKKHMPLKFFEKYPRSPSWKTGLHPAIGCIQTRSTRGLILPKRKPHLQVLDFYFNLQVSAGPREDATICRIYPCLESLGFKQNRLI